MTIFSRFRSRLGTPTTARAKTDLHCRRLMLEPLEDRRLLAPAPLNFTVTNNGGASLKLEWTDNGASGYEIQSSVNGLDDEANPDPWKTGLWQVTKTLPAGQEQSTINSYRGQYFRIQSLPAEDPPLWSDIEYATTTQDRASVKVSANVLPGVPIITCNGRRS